jgi:hypothetical protein
MGRKQFFQDDCTVEHPQSPGIGAEFNRERAVLHTHNGNKRVGTGHADLIRLVAGATMRRPMPQCSNARAGSPGTRAPQWLMRGCHRDGCVFGGINTTAQSFT